MKFARAVVGWVGGLLMTVGFFASVVVALWGDPAAYTKALDSSAVPMLSLVLFLAAVCFAFIPPAEQEEGRK